MHVSARTAKNRIPEVGIKTQYPWAWLVFAREHQSWKTQHWHRVLLKDISSFTVSTWQTGESIKNALKNNLLPASSTSVTSSVVLSDDLGVHIPAGLHRPAYPFPGCWWVELWALGTWLVSLIWCQWLLDNKDVDGIDRPNWPPALTPARDLWDIMYGCIQCCHDASQSVWEMTDPLVQVGQEIPQESIDHLIRRSSGWGEVHAGTWRPDTWNHITTQILDKPVSDFANSVYISESAFALMIYFSNDCCYTHKFSNLVIK